ncbi:MAG: hypothetical protein QM698_10230 [Micropepsaceae bacterium]
MIRSLTVLAFAAAFAAPALAFDNTTCKSFLAGTWETDVATDMGGRPGRIASRAIYAPGGAFSAIISIFPEGLATETQTLAGTWDAAPGPSSDSCNASVATGGRDQIDTVLIVLDLNTIRTEDGATARRVPAAGIRAASIAP